ncbi:hypothetical protein M9Y10_034977 [Tritrichomonas musculus]|uniref:Brl1/Brr6 domain-containing protein n=1 Tax=Tritrichomonas musculus TaxID=1915356 RepID=A0ABR2KIF2_9EUKA
MVVHPFENDVTPFIFVISNCSGSFLYMLTINNYDKVFNQETEYGKMLAKQLTNPINVLSKYDPDTISFSNKITQIIDFAKYCFCVLIIVISILKFFIDIPGDIKLENNKLKFFSIQRRNDCYSEYIQNQCNTTTSPELLKECQKLYECYTSFDQKQKKINFLIFECELVNNFFFFLSKKSAALLGFTFGCILYYNLTH